MKQSKLIMLLAVFAVFVSCNKQDLEINQNETEHQQLVNPVEDYYDNWQEDLQSEDGVLIFKSWAHLTTTNEEMIIMAYDQLRNLEDGLNFRSQRIMLEEIMLIEEEIVDQFYTPYADLSEDELRALNLQEPRSAQYEEALAKGLLTVEEDSPEAHIYYLSVIDPTISRVLNADGLVMVDGTLWQYTDGEIKYCTACNLSEKDVLLRADQTDEEAGVILIDIKQESRNASNWDGNLNKGWTTVENNRRARYRRYGFSCLVNNCATCFMTVKYYLHNEAQRRSWGKWRYKNSYRPSFRWDGSWSGSADYRFCTSDPNAPNAVLNFPISLSGFSRPLGVSGTPLINRRYFGNNNTSVKLHPHSDGFWDAPGYSYPPYNAAKCWSFPMSVTSISITGRIMQSSSSNTTVANLTNG